VGAGLERHPQLRQRQRLQQRPEEPEREPLFQRAERAPYNETLNTEDPNDFLFDLRRPASAATRSVSRANGICRGRSSYTFGFHKRSIENIPGMVGFNFNNGQISAQTFAADPNRFHVNIGLYVTNLTNHANYTGYSGIIGTPYFNNGPGSLAPAVGGHADGPVPREFPLLAMTSLLLDLRHAARVLIQRLGVSAIAIFTLALAIGATTAIFSVVYGVLLRPLPYPAPDRLMAIWEVNHRGTHSRLADPNFDDLRDRNRTFSAMAKYADGVTPVTGAAGPTRTTVATVTQDFFRVVGVQPFLGRGLTADDAHVGAGPVVIVSHQYWTVSLGAAEPLSALHVRIEDRVYSVVGVHARGFLVSRECRHLAARRTRPREHEAGRLTITGRSGASETASASPTPRPMSVLSPRTSFATRPSRATI